MPVALCCERPKTRGGWRSISKFIPWNAQALGVRMACSTGFPLTPPQKTRGFAVSPIHDIAGVDQRERQKQRKLLNPAENDGFCYRHK